MFCLDEMAVMARRSGSRKKSEHGKGRYSAGGLNRTALPDAAANLTDLYRSLTACATGEEGKSIRGIKIAHPARGGHKFHRMEED